MANILIIMNQSNKYWNVIYDTKDQCYISADILSKWVKNSYVHEEKW